MHSAVFADVPTFRIIAPKFICNSEVTGSVPTANSSTASKETTTFTIGFQTKAGQRLQYRLTAYFRLLDGFVSQRHTVGLWRSVRLLERRVWSEREGIAESGQLTIASSELLPGAVYSFGVVGIAEDGEESEPQNFTMTYRSAGTTSFEHEGSSARGHDVSLLLLGAEMTYADVDYSVTAKLIFCRPRNDYSFRWSVSGLDEEFVPVAMERSNLLRIPAGSLTPGQIYEIQAHVCSSSNADETLAKARVKVAVLDRQPTLVLLPTETVVGAGQATHVRALAVFGHRSRELNWSCRGPERDSTCNLIESVSEAVATLHGEGQYTISGMIGNETAKSTLTVHPKVTASVQVREWSHYPAIAGQRFEMLVTVSGLVPNCASNWTVLKEEGFAYFDPKLIGGLGGFFIRDVEENFLSELVDYGNDTIEKDIALTIPETRSLPAQWSGLEADVRYKFSLETVCPEPIDDAYEPKKSTERSLIKSHWTFELETNGAPRGLPLEVSPTVNGTALGTVFKMSTGIAQDSQMDYPLRYSFWYVADGVSVNVGSYYEVTSAETVFPYTRNKTVQTYAVVCDSREACSRIVGPEISVLPGSEPSVEEITFAFESIEAFFNRLNLRQALKTAYELLLTLRNRDSQRYDECYERFVKLLQSSIEHIGKVCEETTYLSETAIQEFVAQAKPILDLKESTNHETFQLLLDLLEKSTHPLRSRSKRATPPPGPEGLTKIDTKLSLMESLTVSKNASVAEQARTNLLNYVHQAAKDYCSLESRYVYAGQLIMIDVNRYRTLQAAGLNRVEGPNKVVLTSGRSQFGDVFPETEYFCLGRVYYARDLFIPRELHELDLGFYEVFLLSVEKTGIWTLMEWNNDYFLWSLDGRRLPNVTCQLWTGNEWSDRDCITVETDDVEVLCNCTRIAYLRITNDTATEVLAYTDEISETANPPQTPTTHPLRDSMLQGAVSSSAEPVMTSAVHVSPKSQFDFIKTTDSDMVTFAAPKTDNWSVKPSEVTATENASSLLQASGENDEKSAVPKDTLQVSSIGYIIMGALAISTLLTMTLLVIYRRQKSGVRLADELHAVPNRTRTQSPHVRYARFQDEHNMAGGDNVSTISDVLVT
ncbi:uncharacterized protein LOC128270504 [Anopheles cruzii]|uniref:uncharacterized protein LOC128270504 n=1 Tax=Anopheles cruzii TaxID=68878 RepID=UPI0022EC222B|nr:uncharacterized protein LOC128270504 [Anopheles cruzii]